MADVVVRVAGPAGPVPRRPLGADPGDDAGSLSVLAIGFVVVAALLVAVVTIASRVFLADRSLTAAADGAALAAVQAVDQDAVYSGGLAGAVPLTASGAGPAVLAYVDAAGLAGAHRGFRVDGVDVEGDTVTVQLSSDVPVPFGRVLGRSGGVHVVARSSAEAPVR